MEPIIIKERMERIENLNILLIMGDVFLYTKTATIKAMIHPTKASRLTIISTNGYSASIYRINGASRTEKRNGVREKIKAVTVRMIAMLVMRFSSIKISSEKGIICKVRIKRRGLKVKFNVVRLKNLIFRVAFGNLWQ